MNIAIVGCGLIGQKRALNAGKHTVTWVTDVKPDAARALAAKIPSAMVANNYKEMLQASNIDIVVIATPHNLLSPIALACLEARKHVLMEKPGGLNPEEIRRIITKSESWKRLVRVGYNHRFHPSLFKAKEMINAGQLGPLMFLRGRYGHGARPGYETEWRADARQSGGGEGIDQGVHLVDLSRWYLGDFMAVQGYAPTYFWDMKVEDNIFMLLKTRAGQAAWLHASWTEWKNLFSLEIYGRNAKLHIEGLGGSYGTEKLTHYKMLPQMGPPEVETWEFPGADTSWALEFEHFVAAVEGRPSSCATLQDALANMETIHQVYAQR
ncbi:MAG TPA: Gfo/Idh/MocA family oxidoreductase [Kiritimatiellia bacterium]|jgi:predicted dehydrogenase